MGFGVTLCITAGDRADLLDETLKSLLPYNQAYFDHAIVTNDRGDEETNNVIRRLLPDATILNHPKPQGQRPSIDEMYTLVATPYIFHCEDDWVFDPVAFIPAMRTALETMTDVCSVVGRQSGCLRSHYGRERKWEDPILCGDMYVRKISMDENWRAHSFNPHLTRRAIWESIGPYAKFSGEGLINEKLEELGLRRASLTPGVYCHIGGGREMQSPAKNKFRAVGRAVKRALRR